MRATEIRLFTHVDETTGRGAGPVEGRFAVPFPGDFALIVEATITYAAHEIRRRQRIGGVVTRRGRPIPTNAVPVNTTPLLLPPGGQRVEHVLTTAIASTPPPGVARDLTIEVALVVDGKEVGRGAPLVLEQAAPL